MIWIWVGGNPFGEDWNLGSVRLFTLEEAMKKYARNVRGLINRGAQLNGWLGGRSA